MSTLTPSQKRAQKAERAKKLLNGSKQRAADQGSDDEVWKWIYEGGSDEEGAADSEDEEETTNPNTPSKRRKRKAAKISKAGKKIVGAWRADFQCRVGDTVLVTNENGKRMMGKNLPR